MVGWTEAAALGRHGARHRRRDQGGRPLTGFSAQWLDRREPADQRSRNRTLERALAKHFDGWRPLTVVDLGCGTGSKRINVEFRRADLARDLEAALGPNANLITASALFDLASAEFIAAFAAALAARQSAFYTVLTYDGD